MTDLTPIFMAVIALFSAILSAFLIPLLRQKADSEDLKRLISLANMGVAAADQLFSSSQGQEKKSFVLEFLQRYDLNVDEVQLEMAIESAVLTIHRQLEVSNETV